MKLHEAIEQVLKEVNQPLSFKAIADLVNEKGYYHRKKDNKPVPEGQIRLRVKNYTSYFSQKEGSKSIAGC